MPICFVIQPFDGGPFDKRFEDTIAPAIRAAGLEPYRVDQDPSAAIPIERIEESIKVSHACVADISTNNPNVWFELGFAIAAGKPVVLLSLDEPNKRFPFDVQHRHIIRYRTESRRDFQQLHEQIVSRLSATMQKEEQLERAAQPSSIANIEGLSPHELVALVAIAENLNTPGGSVTAYTVRADMERAGFTRVAVTLGLRLLEKKSLVEEFMDSDFNGNDYMAYRLTDAGWDWLLKNQHTLVLNQSGEQQQPKSKTARPWEADDEEVPF